MLANITDRRKFESNLDWARAEYAALQQIRKDMYPSLAISLEPGPKSALFARLLSGKSPLAFPPPLSFGTPWYEVIEEERPFHIHLGGMLPVTEVRWPEFGDLYLNYLLINECAWGVVSNNEAAGVMLEHLTTLRNGIDQGEAQAVHAEIRKVLLDRPEWIVKYHPWPEYRLFLGRTTRQARRDEVEALAASAEALDGTNVTVTKVLSDGAQQAAGKAERVAHLRKKPEHLLSPVERKALADVDKLPEDLSALDRVEFECDVWMLAKADSHPLS